MNQSFDLVDRGHWNANFMSMILMFFSHFKWQRGTGWDTACRLLEHFFTQARDVRENNALGARLASFLAKKGRQKAPILPRWKIREPGGPADRSPQSSARGIQSDASIRSASIAHGQTIHLCLHLTSRSA